MQDRSSGLSSACISTNAQASRKMDPDLPQAFFLADASWFFATRGSAAHDDCCIWRREIATAFGKPHWLPSSKRHGDRFAKHKARRKKLDVNA